MQIRAPDSGLSPPVAVAGATLGGAWTARGLSFVLTMAINGVGLVGLALLSEVVHPAPPEPAVTHRTIPLDQRPKRKRRQRQSKPAPAARQQGPELPALDLPSNIQAPELRQQSLDGRSLVRSAMEQDHSVRSDRNLIMTEELVDEPPQAVLAPQPRYPQAARQQGIEGVVELKVLVDQQGGVQQVLVIRATPPGLFEQAAVDAIRRWRFTPARYQGQSVQVWARQRIAFELE